MHKALSIKNTAKISLISLLFYSCFLLFTAVPAIAQTMSNDNYIIQMGNLNMVAGKPTGPTYKLGITGGQTGPGLYSLVGVNYKVRAGFQYIHSLIPFSFKISNTDIVFGELTPANPINRTNTLTVSNGSAHGYQVTVSQNHNLLVPASGQMIPATTCDTGTCDTSTSGPWINSLTYGFGYRCDNLKATHCATGFSDPTYFKAFASSPSAEVIMNGTTATRSAQSQVTYRVNISAIQAAGIYTNIINFIATPTF